MPASFNLTLDTLGPAISAITGAFTGTEVHVTITSNDADAVQVKLWGDIQGAANEAAAPWQAFASGAPITVAVTAGDGVKTINARLRDDVWNEGGSAQVAVTVDTTGPIITITVAPDRTKISKIAGRNQSIFTWTPDSDIASYLVKVVPNAASTHDQGTALANAGGSLNVAGGAVAAATPIQTTITGDDLDAATASDGDYTIKVFAVDAAGNWSL